MTKNNRIYLDYAATSPMDVETISIIAKNMETVYGNPSGMYMEGQQAMGTMQKARESIGKSLGVDYKDVFFTASGTEATNQAIISAAYEGKKKGKNHIISSQIEHPCVLKTLEYLKEEGFTYTLLSVDSQGHIFDEELEKAYTQNTCLVSIMHTNNETGSIQPIKQIGQWCKEKNVLFHCDGTQAVTSSHLNILEMECDYFTLSAHKIGGPRGVGILYKKKTAPLQSLIFGGMQERGRRAGTENVAEIVGTAYALEQNMANLNQQIAHKINLENRLIEGLLQIPNTALNGDKSDRAPGILNISFSGIDAKLLLLLLDIQGIAVSTGSACASGSLELSHVLKAMGCTKENAQGAIRLSCGKKNTIAEMDIVVESIEKAVKQLRGNKD